MTSSLRSSRVQAHPFSHHSREAASTRTLALITIVRIKLKPEIAKINRPNKTKKGQVNSHWICKLKAFCQLLVNDWPPWAVLTSKTSLLTLNANRLSHLRTRNWVYLSSRRHKISKKLLDLELLSSRKNKRKFKRPPQMPRMPNSALKTSMWSPSQFVWLPSLPHSLVQASRVIPSNNN